MGLTVFGIALAANHWQHDSCRGPNELSVDISLEQVCDCLSGGAYTHKRLAHSKLIWWAIHIGKRAMPPPADLALSNSSSRSQGSHPETP